MVLNMITQVKALRIGDVVMEDKRQHTVNRIEGCAGNRNKLHVNGTWCYDAEQEVTVKEIVRS